MTPAINLLPLTTTPRKIFIAGNNNTGDDEKYEKSS
jgi:hypothetical protein